MKEMQFAVPTLFGLEGLAGDELRRMNMENDPATSAPWPRPISACGPASAS